MKKIVLLCSFLALANVLSARTVKLTMSDYQSTSITDKGFTITAVKDASATKPAYNSNNGDLRVYAKGKLTVAAVSADEHILSIEFIISTQGKERMPNLTVNAGEMSITGDPDYTAVWNGNAQSVVFTVSDKAEYAKKTTNSGQLCFTAIRIVTDGSGADDDDTPDLTKEYPLTQGRAFYWGTSSGCSNFSVELYSDGIYFGTVDGEETIEGTGTYATFDIFSDNQHSFIGAYSTTVGTDKVGGLAAGGISQWHVCGRGDCASDYIVSGSLSVGCTPSGKYNFVYDVVDGAGNKHQGQALGIVLQAFTENGSSYTLSNVCTDADVDALSPVEMAATVYATDGQIVVNQAVASDVAVYDLLGRCVARYAACTQMVVPMARGIYVVQSGAGVAKVVVR
ncbi:MAG: hypothetical protein MSS84_05730 [Bacteroidales bacterium]|nr:hypothetical protein [Bacteroidales bacterium]